jgi:hypothetical protein
MCCTNGRGCRKTDVHLPLAAFACSRSLVRRTGVLIDNVQALDRIHRVNPGLGTKRVGVASPCKPRERREMQVHPSDQDTVGADAIEHASARSRGCGEIGIEGHAGFGKRGLHFRHVHRVAQIIN